MKTILLLAALSVCAASAEAQTGRRATRVQPRSAAVDTVQYIAPDSSATDRGSGFGTTPGLSPRTEKSDPSRQAEQKSNATDPQNQTYERRNP